MSSHGRLAFAFAFAVVACGQTEAAPTRALRGSLNSARGAGALTARVMVPLRDGSWIGHMRFASTSPSELQDGEHCPASDFSTHFSAQGPDLEMRVSSFGYAFESNLMVVRAGAYALRAGESLGFAPVSGPCANVSLRQLALRAFDDDGDGIADVIEGRGNAGARLIRGDSDDDLELAFRFVGEPETPRRTRPHP